MLFSGSDNRECNILLSRIGFRLHYDIAFVYSEPTIGLSTKKATAGYAKITKRCEMRNYGFVSLQMKNNNNKTKNNNGNENNVLVKILCWLIVDPKTQYVSKIQEYLLFSL